MAALFGVFLGVRFGITFAITLGWRGFFNPNHLAFLLGWFFGCCR